MKYLYKAKDINGKIKSSSIEASTLSEAAKLIEQQGYAILEIVEDTRTTIKNYTAYSYSNRQVSHNAKSAFSIREKLDFFNSFYHMYGAGISMHSIFNSVLEANKNPKIRNLCIRVLKKIEKGYTLEEAFTGCEGALGIAYTNLIIAGDKSGKLEDVLMNIIKNIKREEEIKHKVISALTYPAINFAFAFLIFLFFKFFLLKVFQSFGNGEAMCYKAMGELLIVACIKITITFAIIFGVCVFIVKNKQLFTSMLSGLKNLPVINGILKEISFLNFFSILGLSFNAGVPIAKSVEMANSVITENSLKYKIKDAVKRIENGCEVTSAFAITNVFSEYAMSQISSGEESGTLDDSCKVIVRNYEKIVETKINVAIKVIQPIMLLLIGLFVLYILYTGYTTFYTNLFNGIF